MQKLISIVIGCVLLSCISWAQDAAPLEKSLAEEPSKASSVADDKKKDSSTKNATKAAKDTSKSEKTDHNFEDLLVQGKYHFSDEAVTTVEEDKVLDSLLGVRTDFKDKIEQSVGRY